MSSIELNGKVYDAHSGGFLRHGANANKTNAHHETTETNRKSRTKSHPTSSHKIHSTPQKAKTLMRHAVKKPQKADMPPLSSTVTHRPRRVLEIDTAKLARAKKIQKSHHVSKFGNTYSVVKTTAVVLPLRPEPIDSPPPAASFTKSPSNSTFDIKPPTRKDFDEAIHRSSSHHQSRKPKTSKREAIARRINVSTRIINISAVSLGILLMLGTIAWQNIPNISMKLASARAGVSASMPQYAPAGFSLRGPIVYDQGQVTLRYESNSDQRSYQVVQVASEMDENTLTENYLSKLSYGYTSVQAEDRTMYLYDDYKATWLEDGIWYRIGGDFPFSSSQLERIADSM